MKRSLFRLHWAGIALLLVSLSASISIAQQPTIQYEITWLGNGPFTRAFDLNNAGTVVGISGDYPGLETAIVWTSTSGIVDLNTIANVPAGWRLASARGINESGQIAGNAEELANPGVFVAYRYDPSNGNAQLMTTFSSDWHDVGSTDPINESGDVLYKTTLNGERHILVDVIGGGLYDVALPQLEFSSGRAINDVRQIAGTDYRLSIGPDPGDPYSIDSFGEDTLFNGINNAGLLAGGLKKKFRGTKPYHAIRAGNSIEIIGPRYSLGRAINSAAATSDGDVCGEITDTGRAFVYMDEYGFRNLDQLVTGTQAEVDQWNSATTIIADKISDRDSTGFGTICGWADMPNGDLIAFVLTPIAPGQTPGIAVNPTDGLVTDETGASDSFDVVINTQPTDDVTIGISSSDTSEGTINEPTNLITLTFTSANWDIPQIVTITGIDDAVIDGNVAYTIFTAAASSADPDYNGLDADDVTVTNLDNDAPSGGGSESYDSDDTPLSIPDNNSNGIASNILAGDYLITNLTVNVNISHQRPSDLRVYLIDPAGGPSIQLFNFSGDNNIPDFNGTSSLGLWTLEVYDVKKKRTGTLNSWSITIDY